MVDGILYQTQRGKIFVAKWILFFRSEVRDSTFVTEFVTPTMIDIGLDRVRLIVLFLGDCISATTIINDANGIIKA